jgi:hypothetical protein
MYTHIHQVTVHDLERQQLKREKLNFHPYTHTHIPINPIKSIHQVTVLDLERQQLKRKKLNFKKKKAELPYTYTR